MRSSSINLPRFIAALVVILTSLALAGYWWEQERSHEQLREETLALTDRHATKLAEAVALQADEMVRGFDIALRHMRADYLDYQGSFEASVAAMVQTYPGAARLIVSVVDADGYLAYRSAGFKERIYAGDRDYFQFQQRNGGDLLYVSKPVKSRLTNEWNIHFVRKLTRNGRFAGVIMVVVSVEHIAAKLSRLLLHEQDVISLFAQDGAYLSRSSDLLNAMGKSVPRERPFVGPDAPASGVFRAVAAYDQVHRIYGWQRLDSVPLVVNVGLATDPVLAPVERQMAVSHLFGTIGSAGAVLALGAVVLLLVLNDRQYARLREHEAELRVNKMAFDAAVEGMVVTDADNRILMVNPAFTAITGYAADEVIGKTPGLLASGRQDKTFYAQMWQSLASKGSWEGEVVNRHKNGQLYVEWLKIAAVGAGGARRHVALITDITVKKRREQEVWQRANFDELTGLPNRGLLADRMAQAIARAERGGGFLAVLFVDLDRFKPVNDSFGHAAGDDLLRQVASRIGNCLRHEDTVARVGGDEFVILLPAVRDREAALSIADKVLASLLAPFKIEQNFVEIGASIGVALYPEHGGSVEALLEAADAAMYRAKEAGRHTVRVCG